MGFPTVTFTPTIADFRNDRVVGGTGVFHEDNRVICNCGNMIHLQGGGEILSEAPAQQSGSHDGIANRAIAPVSGR